MLGASYLVIEKDHRHRFRLRPVDLLNQAPDQQDGAVVVFNAFILVFLILFWSGVWKMLKSCNKSGLADFCG